MKLFRTGGVPNRGTSQRKRRADILRPRPYSWESGRLSAAKSAYQDFAAIGPTASASMKMMAPGPAMCLACCCQFGRLFTFNQLRPANPDPIFYSLVVGNLVS